MAVPPVASRSSWIRTRAPWRDRVRVELERVEAVLELVLGADRVPGQLAGLPRGHEAAAEPVRQRAAEDEAARLCAEDHVGLQRLGVGREPIDRVAERLLVGEERHDVLEDDPRLREVGDVPDLGGEVDRHRAREPMRRASGAPARRAPARAPGRQQPSSSSSSSPRGDARDSPRRASERGAGAEQCRRAVGVGAELPQVPGGNAVPVQARGRPSRPRCPARGIGFTVLVTRGSRSPYSSSSSTNARVGACTLAERAEIDLGLGRLQAALAPRRRSRLTAPAHRAPGG